MRTQNNYNKIYLIPSEVQLSEKHEDFFLLKPVEITNSVY